MEPPQPISDELRRWFADELRRAKLDAMKELAYGASHEINNPLANIALRAQTLLKREDDPDKRKAFEAMHRAAMRAHEMISDLMLFARPPQLVKGSIDLREVVRTVLEELSPRAVASETALSAQTAGEPVVIDADAEQLAVAIRAVAENSLDALGRGGEVVLSVTSSSDAATVRVVDNGPGVPAEIAPHVFDPFFSGREAGRGLGFGLSKCWRIVTDHGGDVRLDSPPGAGVAVTITLPRG
ncbi:sensor histidine kinase [Botrimarina colliarenosi]|uniref:sensor histidine kinase n=1 Tax=Botrimarina colliarenosi TaxID=2528001 RepID=UPI0011B63015|nr:HAMP domain-containing sensor histidine kinase [Botrimarina colliarenosi]